MAVMFLTGAAIFSYPFVVDSLNNYLDQQRIASFQQKMQMKEEKKQKQEAIKRLKQQNKTNIPGMGLVDDPFEETVGKPVGKPDRQYFLDHTVGSIFIPKIHVSLPVFDQTNSFLLEKGATLLTGYSFPNKGASARSVITGHSGLPDKRLFTDLDKLKKGDKIYLVVLNSKYAYEVIKKEVIEPSDFSPLKVKENQDLVTLITCTPYSINTHRLLVTGKRIPYKEEMERQIKRTQNYHKWRFITILFGSVLFLVLFFLWIYRRIKMYRIGKRNYALIFYLQSNGYPVPNIFVEVTTKKLFRRKKGLIFTAVSDKAGQVYFPEIPGQRYTLIFNDSNWPKATARVQRVNDPRFSLYFKKGFGGSFSKQGETYYYLNRLRDGQ